jgi:hypothetical protein
MDQLAASEGAAQGIPAKPVDTVFYPRWWAGLARAAGILVLSAAGGAFLLHMRHEGSHDPVFTTFWGAMAVLIWVMCAAYALEAAQRPPSVISLEPSGLRLVRGQDESFHPWGTIVGRRRTIVGHEYVTSHGGSFRLHAFTQPRRRRHDLSAALSARIGAQVAQHEAEALAAGQSARLPWFDRTAMCVWAGCYTVFSLIGFWRCCLRHFVGYGEPPSATGYAIFYLVFGLVLLALAVAMVLLVARRDLREVTFTPTHICMRWPGGRREIAYADVEWKVERPSLQIGTRDVVVASRRRRIVLNSRMDFLDGALELLKERVAAPLRDGW